MKSAPADKLFRAFADPTRLRVLHLLRGQETCVCDLMGVLRVPQPKVSRHLAYLKSAGLVTDRRQGRWRHYSLAPARSPLHRRLLACLDGCLDAVPALRRDAAALAARRKRGCR